MRKIVKHGLSVALLGLALFVSLFVVIQKIHASSSLTSQVVVGTATPVISGMSVNGGSAITLTANATTTVNVNATITDANGCSEITAATATILLYRSGYTSSTCLSTANNLDCYQATLFTASSTCSGGSQVTTTTFGLYYFAQATDSSSSFSGQTWISTIVFRTPDGATTSNDSAGQTLNTLTAINVTTSTINYGTITANTNTGATDQTATTSNAGNSSTSLQLSASVTLTSGSNVIATSSQGYATSSFNYNNAGSSTALTGTPTTVSGYLLTSPTSTSNVAAPTFWGLSVPNGTPTGTYTGTNVFGALFHT